MQDGGIRREDARPLRSTVCLGSAWVSRTAIKSCVVRGVRERGSATRGYREGRLARARICAAACGGRLSCFSHGGTKEREHVCENNIGENNIGTARESDTGRVEPDSFGKDQPGVSGSSRAEDRRSFDQNDRLRVSRLRQVLRSPGRTAIRSVSLTWKLESTNKSRLSA